MNINHACTRVLMPTSNGDDDDPDVPGWTLPLDLTLNAPGPRSGGHTHRNSSQLCFDVPDGWTPSCALSHWPWRRVRMDVTSRGLLIGPVSRKLPCSQLLSAVGGVCACLLDYF